MKMKMKIYERMLTFYFRFIVLVSSDATRKVWYLNEDWKNQKTEIQGGKN